MWFRTLNDSATKSSFPCSPTLKTAATGEEDQSDLKHISWHTFRRTFSTLLKANGEDIKTVQELLRHANSRIIPVLGTTRVARSQLGRSTVSFPQYWRDLTGKICTKWNERESTWRKSRSCPSRGTSQSKS